MPRLIAPLAHLAGRRQDAIHRARRAAVGLLLEQRGMDLGGRLIHEAIAVQHVEDRQSFTGCQGPRRGRPRRPRTWRAGGPLPPIERRARDADAGTQRRRLARGHYGRDCRHQSGSSLSSGFRGIPRISATFFWSVMIVSARWSLRWSRRFSASSCLTRGSTGCAWGQRFRARMPASAPRSRYCRH